MESSHSDSVNSNAGKKRKAETYNSITNGAASSSQSQEEVSAGDNNNNNHVRNNNSGGTANNGGALGATATGTKAARAGLSAKKLRRLEKNRLSARQCRKRKKLAAVELEKEIKIVERENLRLKLQLQIGEEAEESSQIEQDKVTEMLESKILESSTTGLPVSESEVYAFLEDFKEKFADYGRDRRSAIEFHFNNVARLLAPTTTTSVAIRALQGGGTTNAASHLPAQTCYEPEPMSNLSPKALFTLLVQHLQVTPQQAAELKDSRYIAQELDEAMHQAVRLLEDLRSRFTQCGMDLEQEFASVRAILTPTQSAKFLIWVRKNGACMHMLNELWSKTYIKEGGGVVCTGMSSSITDHHHHRGTETTSLSSSATATMPSLSLDPNPARADTDGLMGMEFSSSYFS